MAESICVRENPNVYIQILFVYLDISKSSRKAKCSEFSLMDIQVILELNNPLYNSYICLRKNQTSWETVGHVYTHISECVPVNHSNHNYTNQRTQVTFMSVMMDWTLSFASKNGQKLSKLDLTLCLKKISSHTCSTNYLRLCRLYINFTNYFKASDCLQFLQEFFYQV